MSYLYNSHVVFDKILEEKNAIVGFMESDILHFISLNVLTDHSNWEARVGLFDLWWQTGGSAIFLFHFKGTPSQEQQKTFRRRLVTFDPILTDQAWI